jgi:hypothetical protein
MINCFSFNLPIKPSKNLVQNNGLAVQTPLSSRLSRLSRCLTKKRSNLECLADVLMNCKWRSSENETFLRIILEICICSATSSCCQVSRSRLNVSVSTGLLCVEELYEVWDMYAVAVPEVEANL